MLIPSVKKRDLGGRNLCQEMMCGGSPSVSPLSPSPSTARPLQATVPPFFGRSPCVTVFALPPACPAVTAPRSFHDPAPSPLTVQGESGVWAGFVTGFVSGFVSGFFLDLCMDFCLGLCLDFCLDCVGSSKVQFQLK